jgi:hypothetical protein
VVINGTETLEANWKILFKVGAIASLLSVLTGIVEITITFLPGGGVSTSVYSTIDWYILFQNNPFLALRNLGLLNIILTFLSIPTFLALFGVHRHSNKAFAALAIIISFIGVAVFLSTNRAFSMLELSRQYMIAHSDNEKTLLVSSGQAMLSVGKSHTPGTFLAFFLTETAGILISFVMLKSKSFNKIASYSGIIAFSFLLAYEFCVCFIQTLSFSFIFAMFGGIFSIIWYILISIKLFRLSNKS